MNLIYNSFKFMNIVYLIFKLLILKNKRSSLIMNISYTDLIGWIGFLFIIAGYYLNAKNTLIAFYLGRRKYNLHYIWIYS